MFPEPMCNCLSYGNHKGKGMAFWRKLILSMLCSVSSSTKIKIYD